MNPHDIQYVHFHVSLVHNSSISNYFDIIHFVQYSIPLITKTIMYFVCASCRFLIIRSRIKFPATSQAFGTSLQVSSASSGVVPSDLWDHT
jgi:hypothetical protein